MTKVVDRGFIESRDIPIGKLTIIWPSAQRGLKEKDVQSIMENFDPEMFGTLAVSQANGLGLHHIIDGQHRKVAVERLWNDLKQQVPCQVYECDNAARAAELFDHINTHRRAPTQIEMFKTRVTAKNEPEVSVNKIVLGCGYAVGGTAGVKNISCVGALKGVYSTYGATTLEQTLNLITAIWGGEDRQATDGTMVRGIGDLLAQFRGQLDFKRLRDVVGNKYTPARLYGGAKGYREIHGGSMANAIKALFINAYNHGQRENKKLRLKDGE